MLYQQALDLAKHEQDPLFALSVYCQFPRNVQKVLYDSLLDFLINNKCLAESVLLYPYSQEDYLVDNPRGMQQGKDYLYEQLIRLPSAIPLLLSLINTYKGRYVIYQWLKLVVKKLKLEQSQLYMKLITNPHANLRILSTLVNS